MITEDYVSFEVAKLLKEKGFDEPCDCYINGIFPNTITKYSDYGIKYKNSDKTAVYSAPTLQMAMKWLRETFQIHIGILVVYNYFPRKYRYQIMHTENVETYPQHDFEPYEEACEESIKYCLKNLI